MQIVPGHAPKAGPTPAAPPLEGTPPPICGSDRLLTALAHPRRYWPPGGFCSEPGWLWERAPEPGRGAAAVVATWLSWGLTVGMFASVPLCGVSDTSLGCNARWMLTALPSSLFATAVGYVGLANVTVGGLRRDARRRILLLGLGGQLVFCVLFAAVVLPQVGFHPGFMLTASVSQVSWVGCCIPAFVTRLSRDKYMNLVAAFNTLTSAIFVVVCAFLFLSARARESERLALSLGFNAVVWALKRAAHWHRALRASTAGLCTGEIWIDGLTSLSVLSAAHLLSPGEFAVFLLASLAGALQALLSAAWRRAGVFGWRRACVIAMLDCVVVQPVSALGLLAMAHLYRPHTYFSLASFSEQELGRLSAYMLVWTGSFLLLGGVLQSLLLRRRRHRHDALALLGVYLREFPDIIASAWNAAFCIFTMITMEHGQIMWFLNPEDGRTV